MLAPPRASATQTLRSFGSPDLISVAFFRFIFMWWSEAGPATARRGALPDIWEGQSRTAWRICCRWRAIAPLLRLSADKDYPVVARGARGVAQACSGRSAHNSSERLCRLISVPIVVRTTVPVVVPAVVWPVMLTVMQAIRRIPVQSPVPAIMRA